MKLFALFLTINLALLAADPTPEELREAGFAALKAAQADPDQIVQAARLLSQAADAFAKAGKDADAQDLESYLFWAKKKMTIQQIDAFLGKGNGVAKAVVAKLEQIEKKEVKVEESVAWLARADSYAAAKTADQFLVAVRYFEVASRFKGTPEGETALDKSLKALQQAKVDSKAVAGKAEKGDGKVYVQSKPVGAQILVLQGGELRDAGLKTPALVQLPVGRAELVLRLAKHDEAKLATDVTTSISKPAAVVMEPERFDLEVTAAPALGDAWDVYVDGKQVMDKAGKPAVAPCTIRLAEGAHAIQLVKEGFADPAAVKVTVKAEGNAVILVKGRAVAGKSRTLAMAEAAKAARLQKKTFSSTLSSVPFEVGAKCFGNRDYTVDNIDNAVDFKGWALVQVPMKTGLPIVLTTSGPTTVMVALSPGEDQLPEGFKDTGKSCVVNKSATKKIYSKTCDGKVTLPPSTGYIVLVESKP